MAAAKILPGLLQKARLDAMRFRVLPARLGGWTVWYRSDHIGWHRIGHTPHQDTALEFACETCGRLAEEY